MCRPPAVSSLFFFNDTATTEIYTLSLHDALPILTRVFVRRILADGGMRAAMSSARSSQNKMARSEEHTSELQSHLNLVCRLLLEKKKRLAASSSCHFLHPSRRGAHQRCARVSGHN